MRQFAVPTALLLGLIGVVPAAHAQTTKVTSASQAVEEYIRAAADSNLTRMGELFGNEKGTLVRQKADGTDKRLLITHAYLAGVKVKAISEVDGSKDNERLVSTEIARGNCKVVLGVIAVLSKKDGWLVQNLNLDVAREVNTPCSGSGNFQD
jgi:hypothetical protein